MAHRIGLRVSEATLIIASLTGCSAATGSAAPEPSRATLHSPAANPWHTVDGEIPAWARPGPDKGGLRDAKLVASDAPIRVYRGYSRDPNKAKRLGKYWALEAPTSSEERYRHDYAICREWNDLDLAVSCDLPANQAVVVGLGESALCDSGVHYGRSEAKQVVVLDPNVLANCADGPAEWTP